MGKQKIQDVIKTDQTNQTMNLDTKKDIAETPLPDTQDLNQYSPADEYNNLRQELIQGRKYVFERPLLIITLSIAALNIIDKQYASYMPPMAIGLLMFNLWFTVNRMRSIARIVAYLQIELEEKKYQPWLGWETSLVIYRKTMKVFEKDIEDKVKYNRNNYVVPDAIGYYPTIYIMHNVIVLLVLIASFTLFMQNINEVTAGMLTCTLAATLLFFIQSFKWTPNRCKNLIEDDRIRWDFIFNHLTTKGIKRKSGNNTIIEMPVEHTPET